MTNSISTQGITLKEGDQFQVGDDSSIYTFHYAKKNEKYGFMEMFTSDEWSPKVKASFRIDTLVEHGGFINKV